MFGCEFLALSHRWQCVHGGRRTVEFGRHSGIEAGKNVAAGRGRMHPRGPLNAAQTSLTAARQVAAGSVARVAAGRSS